MVAEGGAVSRGDSEAEGNDCADVARTLLRLLPMIKIQLEMCSDMSSRWFGSL